MPPPNADKETEDNDADELPAPSDSNNDRGARVRSRLIERRFSEQQ